MRSTINGVVSTHLRLALMSIGVALSFGALSVLYYVPVITPLFDAIGLNMATIRPIHTTFAHLWIYGVSVGFIYLFLSTQRDQGLDAADYLRYRVHTLLWVAAGIGVIVTLAFGVTSGREYLGFHPVLAGMFLLGWLLFAYTFFKYIGRGFFARPVYVYQWAIGVLYFMYTFTEGYAYLLPFVGDYPLVDLQIQWKSAGSLVGSFNFLVYGCLMYLGERLSGDKSYAHSRTAFLLFGVGCLNSFANWGHHTYHLPQAHIVKWIAFLVSMTEIIIVLKVLSDIMRMRGVKPEPGRYAATSGFLSSARAWTFAMVLGGVIISVPSWNALIHGTHVVVGHAMGAELGIDSMILFAVVTYVILFLLGDDEGVRKSLDRTGSTGSIRVLNISVATLVGWLVLTGTYVGVLRYYDRASPEWLASSRWVLLLAGLFLAYSLGRLIDRWLPLLKRAARS